MPQYQIEDPATGKSIKIDLPSSPTEADLNYIFAHPRNEPPARLRAPALNLDPAAQRLAAMPLIQQNAAAPLMTGGMVEPTRTPQPPRTSPMSMLGAPSAAAGGALGEILDGGADPSSVIAAGLRTGAEATLQPIEQQTTPSAELVKRGSNLGLPERLAIDTVTDPWNFIGLGIVKHVAEIPKATNALARSIAAKLANEPTAMWELLTHAAPTEKGVAAVRKVADEYLQAYGIPTRAAPLVDKVDENYGKAVADAYDQMPHAPDDPKVKAAYDALAKEVSDQFAFMVEKAGVKVEPWMQEGQPYANSAEMIADVRDKNHLYYFPSIGGFGESAEELTRKNLLMTPGRSGMPVNDELRAAHDYYGHAQHGLGFGPTPEENASRAHAVMFSDTAMDALFSETRGQNSWVNFGKHIRREDGTIPKKGDPDFVPLQDRPYAEQKSGLLPAQFRTIKPYGPAKASAVAAPAALPLVDTGDEDSDYAIRAGILAVGVAALGVNVLKSPAAAKRVDDLVASTQKFVEQFKKPATPKLVLGLLRQSGVKYPEMESWLKRLPQDTRVKRADVVSFIEAHEKMKIDPEGVAEHIRENGGISIQPMTGQQLHAGVDEGLMVAQGGNAAPHNAKVPLATQVNMRAPDAPKLPANVKASDIIAHVGANMKRWADDKFLGAWTNQERSVVIGNKEYAPTDLDVSKRYPEIDDPQEVGRRRATLDAVYQTPQPQEAIFAMKSEMLPKIGNAFDFMAGRGAFEPAPGTLSEFQQRTDQMYEVGKKAMHRMHGTEALDGREWWDIHGGPLAEIYGEEAMRPMSGLLAATSNQTDVETNLRLATEYMRRLVKATADKGGKLTEAEVERALIRPTFKADLSKTPPLIKQGSALPMEDNRKGNLVKAAMGDLDAMQSDKVNDMAHALVGDPNIGVLDRRFSYLAEDPARGIYVGDQPARIKSGQQGITEYAAMENALRDAAKRHGMAYGHFASVVWEGIGHQIKETSELFGRKFRGSAVPEPTGGFNLILPKLLDQKAKHLGISVDALKALMRNGKENLLAALLATGAGRAAYNEWVDEQAR